MCRIGQDLVQLVRSLWRDRALAAAVIVCLAVGLGTQTLAIDLVDGLLLRAPAGVGQPETVKRLFLLERRDGGERVTEGFPYPAYAALSEQRVFPALTAAAQRTVSFAGGGALGRARADFVDAAFLPLLGIEPLFGRGFEADETNPASPVPVTVLTDAFARDADVDTLNKEMQQKGAWVFGGGLQPADLSPELMETFGVRASKGVLITGLAGQSASVLNSFLFGSITTLSSADVSRTGGPADLATVSLRGSTSAQTPIYLGGVLAGISGGWLALRTTFRGTAEERGVAVRFWGFRAPLGAWVAIWGALAMITSAPFDDWWHNAYGLDVKIISPPHSVLALGMIGIQIGTMLLALAWLPGCRTSGSSSPVPTESERGRFPHSRHSEVACTECHDLRAVMAGRLERPGADEHAPGVLHRHLQLDRHLAADRLHGAATGDDAGLGAEQVELGLDQQHVDAALDEAARLLAEHVRQLSERDVPEHRVRCTGQESRGTDAARHETGSVRRRETVGHAARQRRCSAIDLDDAVVQLVLAQCQTVRAERVRLEHIAAHLEEGRVHALDGVRTRDHEVVVAALQ